MRRHPLLGLTSAVALLAAVLAGCDAAADPAPTRSASAGPEATPAASASSTAPASDPGATGGASPGPTTVPAELAPGTPCEPGSHPDCSNDTGTEGDPWRIIAGYADCVAALGPDGGCTDLDGDDHAGYPDAG